MRSSSFCILVALVYTAGCTSTHVVNSDHPEQWILQAQDQLVGEDVVVKTVDGSSYTGTLNQLGSDSLKLNDDEGRAIVAEQLSNVAYVGKPANAAGPILGCIGGVLLGGLIGGSVGEGGEDGFESVTRGGAIGAIYGGAAGMTIGGLASLVDQYEIHKGGEKAAENRKPVSRKK